MTDPIDLTDWPRRDGRLLCTPERPMPKGADGAWLHPWATIVGDCFEGCCDDYRCFACGHEWRQECAQ